jgi:hypothetical protein
VDLKPTVESYRAMQREINDLMAIKDDSQVAKMRSKNLLIKTFFCHSVMTFKVVSSCYTVPDSSSSGILSKCLTKLRKFSSHK